MKSICPQTVTLIILVIVIIVIIIILMIDMLVPKHEVPEPSPVEKDDRLVEFKYDRRLEYPTFYLEKHRNKIPKIIMQTNTSHLVPKGMHATMWTIISHNPEYDYLYFDDTTAREFLVREYGCRLITAYDDLIPGAYKADLFRYAFLYKYGGVYMDTGFVSMAPLRELIKSDDEFISPEDDGNGKSLYNAFICCVPEHPLIAEALRICLKNIENRDKTSEMLTITGPGVLGKAFKKYMGHYPKPNTCYPHGIKIIRHIGGNKLHKDPYNIVGEVDYNGKLFMQTKYPTYYLDRQWFHKKEHYGVLWNRDEVFHSVVNKVPRDDESCSPRVKPPKCDRVLVDAVKFKAAGALPGPRPLFSSTTSESPSQSSSSSSSSSDSSTSSSTSSASSSDSTSSFFTSSPSSSSSSSSDSSSSSSTSSVSSLPLDSSSSSSISSSSDSSSSSLPPDSSSSSSTSSSSDSPVDSCTTEQLIPKIIVQTNEYCEIPLGMHKAMKQLRKDNPEYEYYYYDNVDRRDFIKKHFDGRVLHAYDSLVPGAFRADLFRYCFVYIRGGVYIDSGMVSIKPLRELIRSDDKLVLAEDDSHGRVCNGFLAAIPKHPLFKHAIKLIVKRVKSRYYEGSALDITGPNMMGQVFRDLYGQDCREGINHKGLRIIRFTSSFNLTRSKCPAPGEISCRSKVFLETKYKHYYRDMTWYLEQPQYDTYWHLRQVYRNY